MLIGSSGKQTLYWNQEFRCFTGVVIHVKVKGEETGLDRNCLQTIVEI
jgi:hypothetical protein